MPQRQLVRRVALNVVIIILLLVLHTEADDNHDNHNHDNRQQPKSEVECGPRHDERQHVKGANDG